MEERRVAVVGNYLTHRLLRLSLAQPVSADVTHAVGQGHVLRVWAARAGRVSVVGSAFVRLLEEVTERRQLLSRNTRTLMKVYHMIQSMHTL